MRHGPPYETYYDSRTSLDRRFRGQARRMRMPAATGSGARAWGRAARKKLAALLGLDRLEGAAARAKLDGAVNCGDHVREHWLLRTQRDVVMPFYLLRPAGVRGPLPAVLCPHGHGGGGKASVAGVRDNTEIAAAIDQYRYDYGVQFARAGLLAFCPDARGFGERQEPEVRPWPTAGSCHQLQLMAGPLGVPVAGLWVFDLMRLMDHVLSRADVAPGRVGCAGLSGGGLQTLYLSAVDTRVACAVVSGYFYGARESLLHMPGNCDCNMIPGLWSCFDQGDVGALIAPRPLLVETGDADTLNGASNLANVGSQVRIARRAYRALHATDRLRHDVFAGPHRWHGVEAVPWMVRWLKP